MGMWGWGYGDTGIWSYGDMGIGGFGDMGTWGYGNMGVWGYEDRWDGDEGMGCGDGDEGMRTDVGQGMWGGGCGAGGTFSAA